MFGALLFAIVLPFRVLLFGVSELVDYDVRAYPDDVHQKAKSNDHFIDGWVRLRDAIVHNGEVHVVAERMKGVPLKNRTGTFVASRVNVHAEVHRPNHVGFKNVPGPIPINFRSESSHLLLKAKCAENIVEPSFFFGLVAYPFYGHILLNVHSNLMHTIKSQGHQFGKVRIYGAKDCKHPHANSKDAESETFVLSGFYYQLFGMLSINHTVGSWPFLLKQSVLPDLNATKSFILPRTFCFAELTIGMTSEWDHYNYSTSASSWHDYRIALDEIMILNNVPHLSQKLSRHTGCNATLISRFARSIVNEQAVAKILQNEFRCNTTIVRLEKLHFLEQVRLMRQTTLLLGMDGTGLLNAAFMSPPAGVISIMMYRLREINPHKGDNFRNLIEKMGLCWTSMEVKHANQSFVPVARNPFNRTVDDLLLQLNSISAGNTTARKQFANKLHEVLMLQDSILDLDEVRVAVRHSLSCIRNISN